MKKLFYTLIFKIPFIRNAYIGREYSKNPPKITLPENAELDGVEFINVILKPSNGGLVKNCTFIFTPKLLQYF